MLDNTVWDNTISIQRNWQHRVHNTVEFVYNEVQGTLDLISLEASFAIRETM